MLTIFLELHINKFKIILHNIQNEDYNFRLCLYANFDIMEPIGTSLQPHQSNNCMLNGNLRWVIANKGITQTSSV